LYDSTEYNDEVIELNNAFLSTLITKRGFLKARSAMDIFA